MLWPDIGPFVGPSPNRTTGGMTQHRGVVLHIASGFYLGTVTWQKNPDAAVSSHFIVGRDGAVCQMVDLTDEAWAQKAGNPSWISVELEGFAPDDQLHAKYPGWETLTPQQITVCARILLKAHQVYGVPLQLAISPAGQGLGHHSMGCENGIDWGHCSCPGEAIKAQKPAILAQAVALKAGLAPTSGDDVTRFLAYHQGDPFFYLCDGMTSRKVTAGQVDDLRTLIREGLVDPVKNIDNPRSGWTEAFGAVAQAPVVDVQALATALTPALSTTLQTGVDTAAVVAAFNDPSVQAVLTKTAEAGANKAETE